MKKWMWIVLVVVLLLLAAGAVGYYKFAHKEPTENAMMGEEHGGVFGSIQDALTRNLSLQCQFTSDEGVATTAYIKAGAVRVDTKTGKPDASSMIMKDKKIYFWQDAQKTGTMMTVPSITVTPLPTSSVKPTGSASAEDEGANALSMLEKFKDSCKVASVADSLFVPPADVKFTDMSQMMRTMQPSGVPSGVPTGMTQQDVQKMMQQYGVPTGN